MIRMCGRVVLIRAPSCSFFPLTLLALTITVVMSWGQILVLRSVYLGMGVEWSCGKSGFRTAAGLGLSFSEWLPKGNAHMQQNHSPSVSASSVLYSPLVMPMHVEWNQRSQPSHCRTGLVHPTFLSQVGPEGREGLRLRRGRFLGRTGPGFGWMSPAINRYSKGRDRSDSVGLGCQRRRYGPLARWTAKRGHDCVDSFRGVRVRSGFICPRVTSTLWTA